MNGLINIRIKDEKNMLTDTQQATEYLITYFRCALLGIKNSSYSSFIVTFFNPSLYKYHESQK